MIIEQARSDIAKKYGITWYKKLFFFLLRHRKTMDFLSKLGWMFQTCALKLDEKNNQHFLDSLYLCKKDRALPFADSKSFLKKYPENIYAKIKKMKKAKRIELQSLLDV